MPNALNSLPSNFPKTPSTTLFPTIRETALAVPPSSSSKMLPPDVPCNATSSYAQISSRSTSSYMQTEPSPRKLGSSASSNTNSLIPLGRASVAAVPPQWHKLAPHPSKSKKPVDGPRKRGKSTFETTQHSQQSCVLARIISDTIHPGANPAGSRTIAQPS